MAGHYEPRHRSCREPDRTAQQHFRTRDALLPADQWWATVTPPYC